MPRLTPSVILKWKEQKQRSAVTGASGPGTGIGSYLADLQWSLLIDGREDKALSTNNLVNRTHVIAIWRYFKSCPSNSSFQAVKQIGGLSRNQQRRPGS
jgi:hypothetical protein